MSLKSFVKDDLWRVNYIYPFAKKHLADEKGRFDLARHILGAYKNIHRVKGEKPRSVGGDIKALLEQVEVDIPEGGFVYFIDEHRTIALPGNVFNNMTVDYEKLLVQGFHERLGDAAGDDEYGRQIGLVADAPPTERFWTYGLVSGCVLPERYESKNLCERLLMVN